MGWLYLYECVEKKDIINLLTKEEKSEAYSRTTIDHACSGNELWCVYEVKSPSYTGQVLVLNLLAKNDGHWGYKDMDESMHPYYYNCPKRLLDICPEPAKVECQQTWRDAWKAHQEAKKATREKKAKLQVGQTWKLKDGVNPAQIKVTSVSHLLGRDPNGMLYKVKARYLDVVVE